MALPELIHSSGSREPRLPVICCVNSQKSLPLPGPQFLNLPNGLPPLRPWCLHTFVLGC